MYASTYWVSVKYIYVKLLFGCYGRVYGVFDRYGSLKNGKQLMFWVLGFHSLGLGIGATLGIY